MQRVLPYLRRTALILGVLFLIVVAGVGFFTRTERFRVLLRDQLVSILHTTFRGEVALERLEGSVWGNLTLHNVTVRYQGAEILSVPRLAVSYSLLPLLWGRVQVFRLQGFEPVVRLKQDAEGHWNLLEALSAKAEKPEEAPMEGGLAVLLDTVVLQGAHIDLTLSGEAEKAYHLAETALEAQIGVWPSGLEIQVHRLVSRLAAEGLPQLQVEASLAYQDKVSPATLHVTECRLDTEHSRVQLNGEIRSFDTMEVDATVSIEKLAASDLVHFLPDLSVQLSAISGQQGKTKQLRDLGLRTWDVGPVFSGTLHVTGPLANLHGNLALAAASVQVTADLQADLSQEVPQYEGTIKVAHLDVQKLLGEKKFAGVVDGTVRASGAGMSLTDLNGEASLQIQALRVGSWQIGKVSFTGSLDKQVGRLSGEITGGLGWATWQGEIHLTEGPRYELAMSVEHLNIKPALSLVEGRVAARQEPVAGELNLKGIVKGKGFALPEMDAQAEIEFLPSTLGPVEIEQGRMAARIVDGQAQISEATFIAKGTTLTVKGEMGTAAEAEGHLSYTLRISELSPWLSLAGQKGTGALTLAGQAKGSLTDLQTQGEMKVTALRFGEFTIQRAAATFDLTLQPQQIAARLTQLSLELPDGTWQISRPVRIFQNGKGIAIEQFLLANRDQKILLDGSISLTGEQNLLLQIDRLALAGLQPVLPQQPEVRGQISARVQVSGTATAPSLVGTANLASLQVAGQEYAGLSIAVNYKEEQVRLELVFRQDAEHTLIATGTLPLSLSWAEGWKTQVLGDLDVHLRSSGLSLAFLKAFTGKTLQEVAGNLSMDIALKGPVSRPLPRGTVWLQGGQAMVSSLGVQLSAVATEVKLDSSVARIEQISARAGEGNLRGSGTITLRGYVPEKLTVSLLADHWPAMHTHPYQVEVGGEVTCEGPLTALKVGGRLEVLQATLRPDLAFLSDAPIERDDTIVILPTGTPPEPSAAEEGKSPILPEKGAFQSLALEVTVLLPRHTWVRHPNATVELAGEVQVTKRAGEDLALAGAIEAVRGWAAFQGRRFTLTQGRVVFTGEKEINPSLEAVAQYRLPEYLVEAVVGGAVKKPSLTLRSEPEMEQADILAVLLFGKPANALGQREQISLQQRAIAITSGYAAAKIGESVSRFLGLDHLGIDLRQVDFTGGRIGLGRYLTPNTYVSASQDLAGKKGQEVSVEYQLTPEWEITTSSSPGGTSGADIFWRKQY